MDSKGSSKEKQIRPSNPSSSQTEPNLKQKRVKEVEEEEEELGVTDELEDFVKTLTVETFKNFPLQQDDNQVKSVNGSDNVQKDLSEWQERHAMLVLTKVKEISLLRYVLCPRYLKDRQFLEMAEATQSRRSLPLENDVDSL
ncbi:hypothetical protein MKX01_031794 [Papaver californicum]|nr:hypothetical protein MKX01_031794 [Papaver californicum]